MSTHQDVSRTIAALHARLDILKLKLSCNLGYFPPNERYYLNGDEHILDLVQWYLDQLMIHHTNRTINNGMSYKKILINLLGTHLPDAHQIQRDLYEQFYDEIHNANATNVFDLYIADNIMTTLHNTLVRQRDINFDVKKRKLGPPTP